MLKELKEIWKRKYKPNMNISKTTESIFEKPRNSGLKNKWIEKLTRGIQHRTQSAEKNISEDWSLEITKFEEKKEKKEWRKVSRN